MGKDKTIKSWVLGEGLVGTENQCIGIAERLGGNFNVLRVALKQPWKSFSPYLGVAGPWMYNISGDKPESPWPDVVIAAGRKAVGPALDIKKRSQGKTLIVQVQDPRWAHKHFDLITVPYHDPYRGDNALIMHGAPNRITQEKLNEEKLKFPNLEGKDIALLIGGKSKAHSFDEHTAGQILQLIEKLAESGHKLMITASRRTGQDNHKRLSDACKAYENVYFWDGEGENPYFAFLANAEHIIVTSDSVSMLSEAASTGKAVYRFDLPGGNKKFDRFNAHMDEIGAIQKLDVNNPKFDFNPRIILNDAEMAAEKIRELLAHKAS